MSLRKIAALTALLSLILMSVSALVAYLAPVGWYLPPWRSLHMHTGLFGGLAGLVYLLCSVKRWTASLREYKRTGKKIQFDLLIAVALIAWLVLSSLYTWWPWNLAQPASPQASVEESIPVTETGLPEKPPFRYSSRAFKGLCDQYGVNADELGKALKIIGIETEQEWSIKRIAEENDMEPRSLYDTMFRVSLNP